MTPKSIEERARELWNRIGNKCGVPLDMCTSCKHDLAELEIALREVRAEAIEEAARVGDTITAEGRRSVVGAKIRALAKEEDGNE